MAGVTFMFIKSILRGHGIPDTCILPLEILIALELRRSIPALQTHTWTCVQGGWGRPLLHRFTLVGTSLPTRFICR